jgi:hypothetical protein
MLSTYSIMAVFKAATARQSPMSAMKSLCFTAEVITALMRNLAVGTWAWDLKVL